MQIKAIALKSKQIPPNADNVIIVASDISSWSSCENVSWFPEETTRSKNAVVSLFVVVVDVVVVVVLVVVDVVVAVVVVVVVGHDRDIATPEGVNTSLTQETNLLGHSTDL